MWLGDLCFFSIFVALLYHLGKLLGLALHFNSNLHLKASILRDFICTTMIVISSFASTDTTTSSSTSTHDPFNDLTWWFLLKRIRFLDHHWGHLLLSLGLGGRGTYSKICDEGEDYLRAWQRESVLDLRHIKNIISPEIISDVFFELWEIGSLIFTSSR